MQDWVEKYRPESLKDIVGNNQVVRFMAEWAKNWETGRPPLLLYGKPGIGKTSSAYALAKDMNWEVVELNASDQRTKGIIEKIAGSTATTMSLSGASRKLLLLDEADNLHGTADKGGARAIMDVIKNSRQPIILIANDIYGVAKDLKSLCEPVQFRALQARSIVPHLKYICSKEKKKCSDDALTEIADSSSGDLRSAVNMLYAAGIGSDTLTSDDVNTAKKDERSSIFELVGAILKGREDRRLMEISYELSDTPDAMEQWIEASLVQIKDLNNRAEAYRYLSLADSYIGRTFRRQYYTLWRYATSIMVLGTASAAEGCGVSDRIMPPSRWGMMSRGKKQKTIRQSVLNKLSSAYHVPVDTLRDEYLKPVSIMADRGPLSFAKELSLDKDELDFFIHDKTRAADIIKEIQKEEREAEKRDKKAKKDAKKKVSTIELPNAVVEIPLGDGNIMPQTEAEPEDKKAEESEKKPSQTQSTLFSF